MSAKQYETVTDLLNLNRKWEMYDPIPLQTLLAEHHEKLDIYWEARLSNSWFKRTFVAPWYELYYWLDESRIKGYLDRSLHRLHQGFQENETIRPGRQAIYAVIQSGRLEPFTGLFSHNLRLTYKAFAQAMPVPTSWYHYLKLSMNDLKDRASAKIQGFFNTIPESTKIQRYETLVSQPPEKMLSAGLYPDEKEDLANLTFRDATKRLYENLNAFMHSNPDDQEIQLYRRYHLYAYDLLEELVDLVHPQFISDETRYRINTEYSDIINTLNSKSDDFFFAKFKDEFVIAASKLKSLAKVKAPDSVITDEVIESKPAMTHLRNARSAQSLNQLPHKPYGLSASHSPMVKCNR
jgi:hypothetical protein